MDFLSRNIWERKYIDLWSLVHVLTGMCFGFSIFFYKSPFLESFIVFVIFSIIWEVLEFVTRATESLPNQILDILTGILGFLATYTIIPILAPSLMSQLIYFTIVYIGAWAFAYFGFWSFALHSNRDVKKYRKSLSAAVILYVAIMIPIFLL